MAMFPRWRGAVFIAASDNRRGLHEDLIDITPCPILAGLETLHDRMLCMLKVLGRVLAGGLVAAADMPTEEAEPKMHPPAMSLEAFLAALRRARLDAVDLIEMRALFGHPRSPFRAASHRLMPI
jgi:hypothetical protein